MDFIKYISTPANTPESNPLISTIKITRGRLQGGLLFFPSGPAGLLRFVAKMGVHQILPFNTGESIGLDDCVFSFSIGIDLIEPPFLINCLTWNTSAQYAHALTVSFSVNPKSGRRINLDTMINEFASTRGYSKP